MADASIREEVYDTFADAGEDVDDQIAHALDVGTDYLDLPIGFLTRIEDGTQTIVQAAGAHDLLRPGERCPLEEAYCRRTVEREGTLSVQDAAASAAIPDRAIERFDLGAYIGATVLVNDETYGTICFADGDERESRFSEAEELFVELLAKLIGQAFERRVYEHELRERNERLRHEKERFEEIAETSFDILFRLDDAGTFSYVSSAVERILGYAPETLIGAPFEEFIAPGAVDDALAAYAAAMAGDPVEGFELAFLDAEGDVVTLEVNATVIEADGERTGVQGVGRDVTARKERQRELRLKNRAMDEARVGISIGDARDPDLPLIYVNEGFERITGYDEASALGRNCRYLQGEATDDDAVATIREAIDAAEPVSTELLNYRRDGTPFWNHLTISPVEDASGTVTHFLGIQTDITDRVRTQKLVQLLNRVLRHNLRNDMTALLGYATALAGEPGDPGETKRKLDDTVRDLMALSDKARELEEYARRERTPRRLDPAAMLPEVAATYREEFPDATVAVDVSTDRAVCAGVETSRALEELLENALEHADSARPSVALSAADAGDEVEIRVRDDGGGIEEMEAAVIADGTETPLEHGAGLGLWMVNWIVTRYGGSFQVATGDDGTVATVRLPAIGPGETVETATRRPTVLFR